MKKVIQNCLFVSDNTIIGKTNVRLKISRREESNLGDFVADSMVDWVSFLITLYFYLEEEISINIYS